MGELRASYPRFRRSGGVAPLALTTDDADILRHVYRHRFLRAEDLFRLFPSRSEDRLSRRLLALFRAGYLDRPPSQIDRYHQGGSQSLVYGLAERGARYLKETAGVAISGADWQARNRAYTRDNLAHTLAVARYLVDVELACRQEAAFTYVPFEAMLAEAPASVRELQRHGRWPVALEWQGARAKVHLVPDAIFGLRRAQPGETPKASYFFVEVDRGTMTIAPAQRVQQSDAFLYRATVLRKFIAYAESWQQQLHRAHLGIHAPRVLFLTTSRLRASSMRAAAERFVVGPRGLPPGMFLFGSHPDTNDPLRVTLVDAAGRSARLVPP